MPKLRLQAGSLTPKSERGRRRAQRLLERSFARMAEIAARVVQEQLDLEKLAVSKEIGKKPSEVADAIMAALQEEFASLAESLKQTFTDAAISGLKESALQVDISDAGMLATSNEAARAWAENRAAELVGMKWMDGRLVANPNAKWAISDTIRDEIKAILEKAFAQEKAPFDDIIQQIQEAASFSEYRAEMVARTEVSRAQIQGNFALWDQSGMVETYDWLLSEDEDVCDECQELADGGPYEFGKGPIPIDDSHPNCRCILASSVIAEPKAAVSQQDAIQKRDKENPMGTEKNAVDAGRVYLSIPITKFDEEQRIVEGIATAEVLDTQGDIVDFPFACDAFKSWEGNIREQHDPKKAVGRAIQWNPIDDQKSIRLSARISKGAQDTWEKVKDGTLKYFSIASPFGGFERKPETMKVGDQEKTVNRLFLKQLSEISLVDQGACPMARIELVKSDGGRSEALAEDEPPVEKLTEDAADYADPGWQDDKQKRYPLDTEEHVRSAASYFGRPRNRKKYTKEQQDKIDAKIEAAKKKFKIGEYADKSDGSLGLCKYSDGQCSPAEWVALNEYPAPIGYVYMPRTFGQVWEDTENVDVFPLMGQQLGRTIANILGSRGLTGEQQSELIQQSFDEFMEEIEDELMEADEEAAGLAAGAEEKTVKSGLKKAGARNSKADLEHIQAMHDHTVALGAECKVPEKEEEKAIGSALEKISSINEALAGLSDKLKTLEVSKMAEGDVAKLAEAITPLIAEKAKAEATNLAANLATKEEVAKAAEITSKREGELEKRLEVVEKSPATMTLPVVRPALGMQAGQAVEDMERQELEALKRVREQASDALTKQAIGNQIFILETKLQRTGR